MADTATTSLPNEDYAFWKSDLFNSRSMARDGVQYALEALRLGFQEGKVGYRESLAIRTAGQPGVAKETDTSPGK